MQWLLFPRPAAFMPAHSAPSSPEPDNLWQLKKECREQYSMHILAPLEIQAVKDLIRICGKES